MEFGDHECHEEGREEDGLVKDWVDIVHVLIRLMWTCFCQGHTLAGVNSDPEEMSEVEEQDFPTIGSESESSTYGLTKKKKKRSKQKKEKNPRRKRNEEEDEDEDEEEDGTMKVS